jgi:four helix bundle protein
MPTVKRFEELKIWQEARRQCEQVHALVQSTGLKNDFSLKDQISRSSGSVMDNIAEGFDRFTRNDFRHFLIISRGSNAEVRSQMYRILDKSYCSKDEIEGLIRSCATLSIKITHLVNHLNKSVYESKPTNAKYVSEADSIEWENEDLVICRDMKK